jgi:hypothetical protein
VQQVYRAVGLLLRQEPLVAHLQWENRQERAVKREPAERAVRESRERESRQREPSERAVRESREREP